MDLRRHEITVRSADGDETVFDMREGSTGTEMGSRIIDLAAARGLEGGYDRARFANDEPRSYDPDAASSYFDAFVAAHSVFERHRVTLGQRVGPIQVWPHGFDLAFEWFGTRTAISGGAEAPAQLNLGFYPGRDPYFYSNPWPFDESLLDTPLPAGSAWHTEGWQGSMLPYEAVAGDPEPAARLAGFARAVFEAAAPTLDAP
jgi:hypothetical protein